MRVFQLIVKNATRHSLRTSLTILGVAIAVTAFCVIRSAIDAWYLNSRAASPDRLIVRNAVSLIFDLPLAYVDRIADVPGVTGVTHSTWFNGIYIDEKNFFAKFAVDHTTFFDLYPEYVIPPDQWEAFTRERNAAIVGRRLADRFGWEPGDAVRIIGDIYPGNWDFIIRGVYTGARDDINESQWFFRYDYIDERMKSEAPARAGHIGAIAVKTDDPGRAPEMSRAIDALFKNSLAETRTETEEAFRLSFVSMSSQIILGLRVISLLVIGVILLVLANTMAMAARERTNEYALLKTLGFRPFHIIGLVFGESVFVAASGAVLGLALAFLVLPLLEAGAGGFLPRIPLTETTLIFGAAAALAVGLLAAVFPTLRALLTPVVDGLRPID